MKKLFLLMPVTLVLLSTGLTLAMKHKACSLVKNGAFKQTKSLLTGKQQRNFSHIFYKVTKDNAIKPLNKTEFASAYQVWTEFAFPMNTHEAWEHDSTLNSNEQTQMRDDEQAFLQKKIMRINPDLRIAWVPTLIQDVLAYQKDDAIGDQAPEVCGLDIYNIQDKKELKNFYAEFMDNHYQLNDYIVRMIDKKYPTSTKSLTEGNGIITKDAHDIVDTCYKYIPNFRCSSSYGNACNIEEDNILLHQSLDAEYKAHTRDNILLYRGTCGNDAPVITQSGNQTIPHSLSYGISLLAGSRNDQGATAYSYMQNRPDAYAVKLNKRDYLNKGNVYNYFFMPALTAYMSLNGFGDLFHPRSRTYAKAESGFISFNADSFVEKELNVKKKSSIRESAFNNQLMHYLINNRIDFKR